MAEKPLCSIPGCGKPIDNRRGWCRKHYIEARKKAGGFSRSTLPKRVKATCAATSCGQPVYGGRHCFIHWQRLRRTGRLTIKTSTRGAALDFCEEALKSQTDKCILWPFPLKEGYGFVRPPVPGRKGPYPQMKASRYVCIRAHGEPRGLHALHTCHNSRCVNPKHLYFGTNGQNIQDKLDAGHQPRGSAIASAVLTEQQAREIKFADLSAYKSQLAACRALGAQYGVSPYTIKGVLTGASWKYVQRETAHVE